MKSSAVTVRFPICSAANSPQKKPYDENRRGENMLVRLLLASCVHLSLWQSESQCPRLKRMEDSVKLTIDFARAEGPRTVASEAVVITSVRIFQGGGAETTSKDNKQKPNDT